jgi:RNA polymerase sigma-70 factor (ECF subfamily)
MISPVEKHRHTIDEAIAHLITRAENSRGVDASHVRARVDAALEKYLFRGGGDAPNIEIKTFIDDIRADDLCLVLACENGDEKAWEDLVANFDPTVRSAARKIAPNSEDADDLASSIWAELYGLRQDAQGNKKSKLAYYSGRGSLAGWLRAVVSQLAIDQFRKQAKFVQIEEDRDFENLASETSEGPARPHAAHNDDPEQLFTEKQTSADVASALRAAIEQLEPEDRLILKLYYFDDLKLKDIAGTFGYHEATASRKLVRVQNEVRRSVEKELRTRHGWSDAEVKRCLSDTATRLGISFEKMLAIVLIAAVLQEFAAGGVL